MLNPVTNSDIKSASIRVRGAHDRHRSQIIERAMQTVVRFGFYSDSKIEIKYGRKEHTS